MKLCAVKDCPEHAVEDGTLTLEDVSTHERFEVEVPLCGGHGLEVVAGAFDLTLDPERMPTGSTTWRPDLCR